MPLPCCMQFSSLLLAEILSSSKTVLRQDEYLCEIQLELSLAGPTGVLEISEPQQLGPSLHVQPAVVAELLTEQREMRNDRIPPLTHAAFFLPMAYVSEQVGTGLPFVSYYGLFF